MNEDAFLLKYKYNWAELASLVIADLSRARETLHHFGLNESVLAPLRKFPKGDEPYGRQILFASANFEVMLATWAPQATCAPHDHGHSDGAVWLVDGEFSEQLYSLSHQIEESGAPQLFAKDSVLLVSSGEIHSMHSPRGGMTLHIYSPAVHAMKVFDPKTRCTLTLADDCGAWIPSNPEKIVSHLKWPNP